MAQRRLRLALLFLSLALSLLAASELTGPANAVTSNANPSKIALTSDNGVYQSSYQNPGFYAQGRYWVFYEDSGLQCEHQTGCLLYVSSANGAIQWSTPSVVGVHVTDNDWSVTTDGANAYYVRYNETSFDLTANQSLLFGKGQLGSNGVISWQPEQIVLVPSSGTKFPNDVIGIDSNGQFWIGYQQDSSGTKTPHVIHSNSTLPPSPLSTSFIANVSDPTVLQTIGFTATAAGGNWGGGSSYNFNWNFGDGSVATGQSVTHQYTLAGNYNVTLNTSDGSSPQQTANSLQTIPVGILPSNNTPPSISVPASMSAKVGAAVTFPITLSDTDGDQVNLSSSSLPAGASLNVQTGKFSWTPTPDQANQFWSFSFTGIDNASLSVMKQVLVYVSPSWSGDFVLSNSIPNGNWHVDIATLGAGSQVYAGYWVEGHSLLGRLYNGTSWGFEEQVSNSNPLVPDRTSTDVNSFIFAYGTNVYAIYYDTNSENITWATRGPLGGWGQNLIGLGEAKSASSLGRYSLPFTASLNRVNATTSWFYVFWYNQARRAIDEWSGTGQTWYMVDNQTAFYPQSSLAGSTIGSIHYSAPVNGQNAFGIIWTDGIASPYNLNFGLETVGPASTSLTDTSWNPRVSCTASVVTVEQVLGTQPNSHEGATQTGSIFSPGITTPLVSGEAKRWLTPGPTPPNWLPNGPQCNITNADGQMVSTFVEIRGVQRGYVLNEDYSPTLRYDAVNGGSPYPTGTNTSDSTFLIFTPGYGVCNSTNTTGCMHSIHVEIDRDWKAAGYCGVGTACDVYPLAQGPVSSIINRTLIDVQGFIYWDPDHTGDPSHAFSGWEIHPVTAWRKSNLAPTLGVTANPTTLTLVPGKSATSTIMINSTNLFSGQVSLAATVSPSGPASPSVTLSPSTVTVQPCNACAFVASTLNVTATPSSSGPYTITITATGAGLIPQTKISVFVGGFSLSTAPSTLNIPTSSSAQSIITITSLGGFNGPVALTDTVNGCSCGQQTGFNTTQVTLSSNGSAHVAFTITTGSKTGTDIFTITGTSSTSPPFSAFTTLSVNIQEFTVTAGQTVLTTYPGSPNSTVIKLSSQNGFAGTVTIKATSNPIGLSLSLNTTSVTLTSGGTAFVALTVNGTQPGIYTVTVNATSGSIIRPLTITVKVVDFTLSSSSSLQVDRSSTGTATINFSSQGGFVGTVSLSNTTSSTSLHDSLSTLSISLTSGGSGSVILTVFSNTATNVTVTITATSGPLRHSVTITVNVVDFQLLAGTVAPASINAGSHGNATITATGLNGFAGNVALTISGPSGLTCSLSPASLKLPPSPVTSILSCSSSTAGDYTVIVTGTDGTASRSTGSILFHIVDFTITPSSPSINLVAGQSTQTSVGLSPVNGFAGTVTISLVVSPSGPTATSSKTVIKLTSVGNSTVLTINAGQNAGIYALNITGTSGPLSHSTIITLNIAPDSPTLTTSLSSSSISVGNSATDSASLNGATTTAGGTVKYYLFTNGVCNTPSTNVSVVAVSNGVVPSSRPIVFNATGTYSFNATYSGDANNSPATSPCEPLVVQKANPTIVTALLPSSSIQVGQSATDSATLSNFFQASGTVDYNLFAGSSTCAGTGTRVSTVAVNSGSIPNSRNVVFNSTNTGGYSFQAIYSGDASNNLATSTCEPLTVNPVGVVVTTTLSASSVTVGGNVFDSATLKGQTSSAGGTVTYTDFPNGNCAGTGVVVSVVGVTSGVVPNSRSVTYNSTGTFSFDAAYSGDANNNRATSGCESLTVNKAVTSISTSISPTSTIIVGGAITDQATLTGGFPAAGVTGTATYSLFSFPNLPSAASPCSGGSLIGSPQNVNVGIGDSVPPSAALIPPSAGFYGVSATYNGDGNNTAVTGNCEPLTVNKQTPAITTAINPFSIITVGSSVTDQATITGGFPSTGLSGTVAYHFFGLGNTVCSGTPIATQTVSISPGNTIPTSSSQSPASVGKYSFNATYSGDTNNNGVTSSCELLTVNPILTTTSVTCGSSITIGVPTQCTVTVSDVAPGSIPPSGTVNFATNSTGTFAPASCTLTGSSSSTSCSVFYTPNELGSNNITATYPGDNTHTGSSGSRILSPGQHSTGTSVNCTSPVIVNQASTCTATVTDNTTVGATTPTGTIIFSEITGVAGNFNATSCTLRAATTPTATCSVSFTPSASSSAGASINGNYGGDSTHSPSSGSSSITVSPRNTSTSLLCTSPVVVNQDSTCTATVSDTSTAGTPITPAGTVSFAETGVAGSFTTNTCTLSGSGATASCSSTFRDSTVSGTASVSASYTSSNTIHSNSATSTAAVITVNSRTTSTVVSCTNPVVVGQASTCTATVMDTSSAGTPLTPTGAVSFSTTAGSLTGSPCSLASGPVTGNASCTVSLTASAPTTANISASYTSSDTSHSGSQSASPATVTVNRRSTATTVSCSTVNVGQASTCTVTVSDVSLGTPSTPGGAVSVTASGGSVTPTSASCSLSSGSCIVMFTPQSSGAVTVNATYIGGDSIHNGSSGITSITPGLQGTSTVLSCATPIVVNQGSSCTATVTSTAASGSTTPTGTVNFSTSGSLSPASVSCTLTSGSCTLTFTGTAQGTTIVTGNYTGDNAHSSSKNTASIIINLRISSAILTCTAASVAVNASDSCTVYVKDKAVGTTIPPSGSVSFDLDGSSAGFTSCTLSTLNATTADCSAPYMPAGGTEGPHTVSAMYPGDPAHSGAGSNTIALNVTQRTTSTTINCSPSTLSLGQSTTCTATVRDTSGGTLITPTGSVTFSVAPTGSGSFTGNCSLSQFAQGTATCNINYAPSTTGSQTITGSYIGDQDHSGGPGSFNLSASTQATTTATSCTPSSIVVNTNASCIATLRDSQSGSSSTTPTGTISFTLDSSPTVFASCQLTPVNSTSSSCSVTYTPSPGTEGSHNIVSTYTPDSSHGASSASFAITAVSRTSATSIVCSSPSVSVNSNDPCTATVKDTSLGNPIIPSGGISFYLDGSTTSLGSCSSLTTVNSTSATCAFTFTPLPGSEGSHSITAKYSGDTDHLQSGSSSFSVLVTTRTTTTSLVCSPPSVSVGQTAVCTATVRDTSTASPITPSGSVSFSVIPAGSGSFSGACILSQTVLGSSSCNVNYTPSSVAAQTINGAFTGDTDHSASQGTFSLNVNLQSTATTISCAMSSVPVDATVSCTTTVRDSPSGSGSTPPAGSVSLTLDSSTASIASCNLQAINATASSCSANYVPASGTEGPHTITTTYIPDSSHASSSSSITLTVVQRSTATTILCFTPVVVGQSSQCTSTVTDSAGSGTTTPSGTVSFTSTGLSGISGSPCSLIPSSTVGVASCSVTFIASSPGTATINAAYTSTDSDHAHSQTAAGNTVTVNKRTATTSLSCTSPVVVDQVSTCTVTVEDNSTAGTPVTPSGQVSFATTGAGLINPSSCTLNAEIIGTASCTTSFTRSSTGTSTVSASYVGDTTHAGSASSSVSIVVGPRTTTIGLSCSTPVVVDQASQCTATVNDTSPGTPITPTGNVALQSSGTGSFLNSCVLSGSGATASCSVNYLPTGIGTGTHTITAKYDGDGTHSSASPSATSNISVSSRSTATSLTCTSSITVSTSGSCTVTVTDISQGTFVTPTGTVAFTTNSTGSFSPTPSCFLSGTTSSATCSLTYMPNIGGHHNITSTYNGDGTHLGSVPSSFNIATSGHPTTTTVTCTAQIVVNQESTCLATVTDTSSAGTTAPKGTVSFTQAGAAGIVSPASCILINPTSSSQSCTATFTPSASGTATITGTYIPSSSDTTHNGSTSTSFSIAISLRTSTTTISCATPVVVNQASSCTATVTDTSQSISSQTPAGTVTFTETGISGVFAGSPCNLVPSQTVGVASCIASFTAPSVSGTAIINANYTSTDADHASSSTTTGRSITVNARSTSISISCTTPVTVNVASTCAATVTDMAVGTGLVPTGTVAFAETGSGSLTPGSCSLSGGGCSVSFTATGSGSDTVTGTYSGDQSHSQSSSSPATITANPRTTSTTLACSSPVVINQASTCNAFVTDTDTGTPIIPTGNVTFLVAGSGSLSSTSCKLSAGSCSVTFTGSATGTSTIAASYVGDNAHGPSPTSSAIVTVGSRTTITSLTCGFATLGSPSPCTITVSDNSPGTPISASGNVALATNSTGTFDSTCTLSGTSATATCTVNYTPTSMGPQQITASYAGDATHSGSIGSIIITPGLLSTTTSVSCSTPVVVNQPSNCIITIKDTASGATTPTGTVTINVSGLAGSINPTTCQLTRVNATASNCSASFTPSATGRASITGTYSGDSTHNESTSPVSTINVNPRSTSITVNCATPVLVNIASICNAVVTDTSPGTAALSTGTVTFSSTGPGSLSSTNCSLTTNTCSVSFTGSSAGSATVTGSYLGDSVHTGSVSPFATIAINLRTTLTIVTCTSSVVVNQPATCTATVIDNPSNGGAAISPAGSVLLTENGVASSPSSSTCTLLAGATGSASCVASFTPLASGTAGITGVYTPSSTDTSHQASPPSTAASVVVSPRLTIITVSCSSQVVVNQASTCTATATDSPSNPGTATTPTGAITFTETGIAGGFTGSPCNTVIGPTLGTAGCSASFTPSASGTANVNATFVPNDQVHSGSSATSAASISATLRITSTTVSCTTTVVVNQASSCTATVTDSSSNLGTPINPSGTVTFSSSGTATGTFTILQCTLVQSTSSSRTSSCSTAFTGLASGNANVNAGYSSASTETVHADSSSTTAASITVGPRTTTVAVSCVTPVVVGEASTCTATVSDSSSAGLPLTPGGTVGFSETGVSGTFSGSPCTLVPSSTSGTASCIASFTSPSSTGSASVSAVYSSTDNIHSGSSSTSTTGIVVNLISTSMVLSCSSSATIGSSASCIITVSDVAPGTPPPTGTVKLSSNSTGTFNPATCILPGTTASESCTVAYTPTVGGHHLINATYIGDSSHTSIGPNTALIATTPAPLHNTTTSISCVPNPVIVNQASSCSAAVTDINPSPTAPSGTVTFAYSGTAGSISSSSCVLVASSASQAVCQFPVSLTPTTSGTGVLTASYSGDSTHIAVSSPAFSVIVNARQTTSTVSCTSPVLVNEASTCTAIVSDSSPAGSPLSPTGSVSFFETGVSGSFQSSPCQLISSSTGIASCSTTFTAPAASGSASISAAYTPSDNVHSTSQTSTAWTITVTQRTATTSVQCTSQVVVNQPSTCTAVVTDSSASGTTITPAGTVRFSEAGVSGSFTGSPCNLTPASTPGSSSCTASFTASSASGTANVNATYTPSTSDTAHIGSSSATPSKILVTPRTTITTVSCSSPVVVNQPASCTATVTDSPSNSGGPLTPSGSVGFSETGVPDTFTNSQCNLIPTTTIGIATCTDSFVSSAAGTASVSAAYATSNSAHSNSATTTIASITVNLRTTAANLSCTSSVVVGQASSCNVIVTENPSSASSAITPGGTVSFTQSGVTATFVGSPCTLQPTGTTGSATCTVTLSASSTGSSTVTATYNGDGSHGGSNAGFAVSVNTRSTTTHVTCSAPIVIGQASQCKAVVNDTDTGTPMTPSGSVSFASTGSGSLSSPTCNLTGGSCTVSFTGSSAGTATVTGTYVPDAFHSASTSTATSIAVGLRRTTTIVTCSPTNVGQGSTCVGTVTDSSPDTSTTPIGNVTFTASGGSVTNPTMSCNLVSGACSVIFVPQSSLAVTITGVYKVAFTDTTHSASQGNARITPGVQATSTSLVCSGPIIVNQDMTCTATVTSTATNGATSPFGDVSFTDAGAGLVSPSSASCVLASSTSPSSTCTVKFAGSASGEATINATYIGNSSYQGGSGLAVVTVNPRTTSIVVSCTSSIVVGQPVSCTATVVDTSTTGSPITPAGAVDFNVTGLSASFAVSPCHLSGTGPYAKCTATFLDSTQSGTARINAVYRTSDSIHSNSTTTTAANVSIALRSTTVTVSCQPSSTVVGNRTSCVVTVTDTSSQPTTTPTGTVTFYNSTGEFATCTLSSLGKCSAPYTPTSVTSGPQPITVSYSGDSIHDTASGTTTISVTIKPLGSAALPLVSYSILGVIGFLAVLGVAILFRRIQRPRRRGGGGGHSLC